MVFGPDLHPNVQPFKKTGSSFFFICIPIWFTKSCFLAHLALQFASFVNTSCQSRKWWRGWFSKKWEPLAQQLSYIIPTWTDLFPVLLYDTCTIQVNIQRLILLFKNIKLHDTICFYILSRVFLSFFLVSSSFYWCPFTW